MRLRPYQLDNENDIYNAWDRGAKNVLSVKPTGSGKTVVMSDIIKNERAASCAIAHRQELVSQISLALARNDVRHRIIGPKNIVRLVVSNHMAECGMSYYDPSAPCAVAGVDTLVRRGGELHTWLNSVKLWVQDEAHHVLKDNKWGKAASMFPNARGLGVTATPLRADGFGLGRHADGLFDEMIEGPQMRELINMGYLTDYKVFAPKTEDLYLSDIPVSKTTGDFNPNKLKVAIRKSHVVGDVVKHYLRIAPGKLGITFATDVETATDIAAQFNAAAVPAAVVSAKTPDAERIAIIRKFKNRELLQLVNVDLFGEGFDLPAIEVVSMARPTQSYALYCLDPETEILTPEGWKNHNDMDSICKVIGYDLKNDEVKTVEVLNRVKRDIYDDENMYGIAGPHLDINVSDNHNMIVKGRGNTCVNWVKEKACETANRKSLFTIPVAGNGLYKGSNLTKSEIHLLGWYLSDGTINRKTNGLSISQAVNKTEHINHIRNTLVKCGLKFGESIQVRKNAPSTHHNLHRFTISKGQPRGTDKHLSGWAHLEKWMSKSVPECYDDLTRSEFKELLITLNLGDGANNHSSLNYIKHTLTITCGDNKLMADRLQALSVTRGFRCNMAMPRYEGCSKWYILHIRDCTTSTIAGLNVKDGLISNKKKYKRSRFKKLNNKPSFVWCVENELGTLVIRRNGKVSIVGNCQQFGRALRLMLSRVLAGAWDTYTDTQRRGYIAASVKPHAIIIDHVGNTEKHNLPDKPRIWTLDRREKRAKSDDSDVIPLKACPECTAVYERIYNKCPECGYKPEPMGRSAPEHVDGDLIELSAETLAEMRGEIANVYKSPDEVRTELIAKFMPKIGVIANVNRHIKRQEMQKALRMSIAWWGGYQRSLNRSDSESYRRFYFAFGIDVLSCQTLNTKEALTLAEKINNHLGELSNGR